jgi:hypothetical protein
MRPFVDRLAREPAALGTLVASILPALVALRLVSLDAEAIGVLVVAVNTIIGFLIRFLVAPTAASAGAATPGSPATGATTA